MPAGRAHDVSAGRNAMRDGLSRRSPEPHVAGINVVLVDVALWLLLGIAAQVAIRLIR